MASVGSPMLSGRNTCARCNLISRRLNDPADVGSNVSRIGLTFKSVIKCCCFGVRDMYTPNDLPRTNRSKDDWYKRYVTGTTINMFELAVLCQNSLDRRHLGFDTDRMTAYQIARAIQNALAILSKGELQPELERFGWLGVPWQLDYPDSQRVTLNIAGVPQQHAMEHVELYIVDTAWNLRLQSQDPGTFHLDASENNVTAIIPTEASLVSIINAFQVGIAGNSMIPLSAELDIGKANEIFRRNRNVIIDNSLGRKLSQVATKAVDLYVYNNMGIDTTPARAGEWRQLVQNSINTDITGMLTDSVTLTSQYASGRSVLWQYRWVVTAGQPTLSPTYFTLGIPYWATLRHRGKAGVIISTFSRWVHTCNAFRNRAVKDICCLGALKGKYKLVKLSGPLYNIPQAVSNSVCWYPFICGGALSATLADQPTNDTDRGYILAAVPEILALLLAHYTTLLTTKVSLAWSWSTAIVIDNKNVYGIGHIEMIDDPAPQTLTATGNVSIVTMVSNTDNQNNTRYYLWRAKLNAE